LRHEDRHDERAPRAVRRATRALSTSLLFVLSLLSPDDSLAGAFDVADESWEGCQEFFAIAKSELGEDRVKPLATLDWSKLGPDDGLLILHPERPVDPLEASEFMKLGGRVAVLDDFGASDELLRRFKVERIPMPGPPLASLRNNPELALAEPFLETSAGQIGTPHPIASQTKRLVLNHPMALLHPDLSPVLRVRLKGTSRDAIVAVAGQVEKGRLFAMTDPSAVINSMLRYPGNRSFAVGVIRYLASDGERSQGTLYVVANRFEQEGSVGGERSLAQQIEAQLRTMLEALANARRDGLPPWAMTLLAGMVLAGVAAWVARTTWRSYRTPTPRYAQAAPWIARGGAAGRFAMLAAPSSPKSLVLLELKSALVESVAARFGLEPTASTKTVVTALRDKGVDRSITDRLESVFGRMARVESAVLAHAEARVTDDDIDRAARLLVDLLAATQDHASPRTGTTESGPPVDALSESTSFDR
jgi:hypothetical protein